MEETSKNRHPIFSGKETLHISTGNTVDWQRLRRKTNLQSHEELELCLSEVINAWMKTPSVVSINGDLLRIDNNNGINNNNGKGVVSDRDSLKYTVKAFPSAEAKPEDVLETIEHLLKELEVDFVDALIVALPGFGGGRNEEGTSGGGGAAGGGRGGIRGGNEDIVPVARPRGRSGGDGVPTEGDREGGGIDDAMKIWRVLENLVNSGRASSLGVADLSKIQLEELLREAKTKPIVNQVNLTTCCVIADDLKALAKDHDVQLMIHNDPRVMIDEAGLDRLLLSAVANSWSVSEEGATGWRPTCLLRYSAMVKGRGVIKTKGYSLKATKV